MSSRKLFPGAAYGRWSGNVRLTDDYTGMLVDRGALALNIVESDDASKGGRYEYAGKYQCVTESHILDLEGIWIASGNSLKLSATSSLTLPEVEQDWNADGSPKKLILNHRHSSGTVEKIELASVASGGSSRLPDDNFAGSLKAPIRKVSPEKVGSQVSPERFAKREFTLVVDGRNSEDASVDWFAAGNGFSGGVRLYSGSESKPGGYAHRDLRLEATVGYGPVFADGGQGGSQSRPILKMDEFGDFRTPKLDLSRKSAERPMDVRLWFYVSLESTKEMLAIFRVDTPVKFTGN